MSHTPIRELLIALGSNLGNRMSWLDKAKAALEESVGPITANANVYETAPVGPADQPFLNSAVLIQLNAHISTYSEAMRLLLDIEKSLGRTRELHWGNRTIDLDILLARDHGKPVMMRSPLLELPHPRMLERDFVLVPACDIAAHWIHPDQEKSLMDLCSEKGFRLTSH